jgi:hypothetical protein
MKKTAAHAGARMLVIKEFMGAYDRLVVLLREEKYPEMLELAYRVLASPALPEGQRDRFLYFRAVALDMTGDITGALEIFRELRRRGAREKVVRSMGVVLSRLLGQALERWKANPRDPVLRSYHHLALEHDLSPVWLTFAVAGMDATEGLAALAQLPAHEQGAARRRIRDKAFETVEAYLDLSPNDPDYLRCSLELLEQTGDGERALRLLQRVADLQEHRPWWIPGAELLERFATGAGLGALAVGQS